MDRCARAQEPVENCHIQSRKGRGASEHIATKRRIVDALSYE